MLMYVGTVCYQTQNYIHYSCPKLEQWMMDDHFPTERFPIAEPFYNTHIHVGKVRVVSNLELCLLLYIHAPNLIKLLEVRTMDDHKSWSHHSTVSMHAQTILENDWLRLVQFWLINAI